MNAVPESRERRASPSTADLIDRVLDRGIVIDSECRVAVAGVHLATIDMWLVVASLETYRTLATGEAGRALGLSLPDWMSDRPSSS